MFVLCPVCQKEFEIKPAKRDDKVTCCPRCSLHAEVSRKKDEFGTIWKVTFTEKPKEAGGPFSMGDFLFFAWIIIIVGLVYLIYLYISRL
jgi:hypothetical protein